MKKKINNIILIFLAIFILPLVAKADELPPGGDYPITSSVTELSKLKVIFYTSAAVIILIVVSIVAIIILNSKKKNKKINIIYTGVL